MANEEKRPVIEWSTTIDRFGTPIESSILQDDEWEKAKRENRVISLLRGDGVTDYRGEVGLVTDNVF